jgi:hypothetical protein
MTYNSSNLNTMVKVDIYVENMKFRILEVALRFTTEVFITPKNLNDFKIEISG